MKNRLTQVAAGLCGTVLLGLMALSVHAEEGFVLQDPILEQNGIEYAITGVAESKEDPRWDEFPLKLVFAAGTGALYSDVTVEIRDSEQKVVLDVMVNAPWLVVKLEAGNYDIKATDVKGEVKSLTVRVPSSGQAEYTLLY